MPQVMTLGETMAAFTPGGSGPLRYVPDYRMRIAGAESNTAIGLCKLGCSAGWFSRLGDDEFGHYVFNSIRAEGVDVSNCIFDRERRTGIMFKETGADETKVYYYRENSAASRLSPADLPADALREARILHLTGITPVLSPGCRETVLAALSLAEQSGALISFDPNIRKKLWGGSDYTKLLRELTLRAQIVFLGLDEAQTLFGLRDPELIFERLFTDGKAAYAAIKNGKHGAWVADAQRRLKLEPFPCNCVEPVGAGDAFNAGFLAGLLQGRDLAACGQMGAIAGGLATTTPGDIEGYPSKEKMDMILSRTEETYR